MDFAELLKKNKGKNYSLHTDWINPQFAKVLKTIGLDRCYTRAQGMDLFDHEGRRYRDFLSGYGVFALGRNHPELKQSLKDFIDLDTASLIQMEAPLLSGLLAKKLIEKAHVDKIKKVFFTNSGTEANEAALKFARAATQRERILFLDHAFHGLTTGSLALNGSQEFRRSFGNLLPGNQKIPFNDLAALEKELAKKDVAAFFVEPIQGKGVYIHDENYLQKAQELCRQYGTLFVIDEIQTGLGRTGKFFAYQHWNLKPDIITISKALSGGMVPVGATLYTDSIYKKVYSRMDRCVVHSSTFGQNNLAMAMGLATLELIEKEDLEKKAAQSGDYLLKQLQELAQKSEWIKEVRGMGLMIGIEFGKPKSFANKVKWKMIHQMDKGLFGELIVIPLFKDHGILTQVSGHHQDIIKLIPPLIITQEDIDSFIHALTAVLDECGKLSGPLWDLAKNLMASAKEN